MVVSPDVEGLVRATKMADILRCNLAIIHKKRKEHNICDMGDIIGEVGGKNYLLLDDIVDTGNTLCKAAGLLKEQGAKSIKALVTHAVLSNDVKQKLAAAPIDKTLTTNTIPQEFSEENFKVMNITPLIRQAIKTLMKI
jgi:ribose-phosphate pyrophosphokinase